VRLGSLRRAGFGMRHLAAHFGRRLVLAQTLIQPRRGAGRARGRDAQTGAVSRAYFSHGDRGFESFSLQQRVGGEPAISMRSGAIASCATTQHWDPIPQPGDRYELPPGDLWLLRRHRLLCGSALDATLFAALMGEKRAVAGSACLCGTERRRQPCLLPLARDRPNDARRLRRVRFAKDSPVEGDGFEPSVPRQKDNAFRDSSFPTCARHRRLRKRSPARPAAASSSCRSRSDERRTHSPTRRSSGPPHRRHHHPFAFNHRVVLLPCPLHLLLLRCRAF
jgi:hypothetical protein